MSSNAFIFVALIQKDYPDRWVWEIWCFLSLETIGTRQLLVAHWRNWVLGELSSKTDGQEDVFWDGGGE